VAFEVLVATYVLTFYEEANNNLSEETGDETINNRKRLLQLARRDPEETTKKPVWFKGRFRVAATQGVYKVKYPVTERGRETRVTTTMDLTQFPVVGNFATTGHKLQGKSVNQLVIAEWSTVKNWAYVVLSRVRTLAGLFLEKTIPYDIDFTPNPDYEYLDMMERLRATILVNPIDTESRN
jgi:hypothetical protein